MPSPENDAFRFAPIKFIQENPVEIQHLTTRAAGELYGSGTGAPQTPEVDTWLRANPQITHNWDTIAFDLVTRSLDSPEGKKTFCVQRLDQSNFTSEQQKQMGATRYNAFYKAEAPIKGYWFPYLSPPGGTEMVKNGTWGIAQMGQVDFPKNNPKHRFVFTGQMNGCALVITDSPLGDNYYRAYHYPNVSTYPKFKPSNTWPQTRRYVWTVDEYGALNGKDYQPNAWNFLHYTGGEWYLCCQPVRSLNPKEDSWFSLSNLGKVYELKPQACEIRPEKVRGSALPGAIRLSHLTNTFV
jgi:hypothetical protein